jgi:protein phosphatase
MNSKRKAPASKQITWSGETDRGKVRTNNEDAFLGIQFDSQEVHRLGKFGKAAATDKDFVFAVSDGMGGAKAGELASRIAVEKITALLPRSFQQSQTAAGLGAGFEEVLTKLFDDIHGALAYVGNSYEECKGMETTLSLCWFTPRWVYFAHIGDSRIYHLPARGNGIKQLSQDDTHVDWLLRNGHINEREARSHPRRNVLQKSLGGSNQFITPQLGVLAHEPGDIFLLCSDGLVEGLYDNHLEEFLRPPKPAKKITNPAHQLVKEALEKDGRDNITALVIQMA